MVEVSTVCIILNNLVEFELITLDICLSKKPLLIWAMSVNRPCNG